MREIVRKSEKLQVRADPQSEYLHSGFGQVDFECQLLPGVDIRVVGFGKDPLQLLQLGAGERGPDAPLLPLLVQSSVVREELVGYCRTKIGMSRMHSVRPASLCSAAAASSDGSKSQTRYFV